uniref:Protein kinase domain-containing protein n=1 Tax=Oryzias melastigma TaxID=30732 RepID=A0A3B3DIH2_ORYME
LLRKEREGLQEQEINEIESGKKHNLKHIYRKVRCVGQGTFGTVVIYRQCPTSNQVAVKLSRERLALHEANILEKIKDADPDKNNLLKLVEHFSLQYEHCIVTEKLDQDILHYMCQQSRRPMTVSEIRPIAQQLLVALKALKSMGLVHADIKPNNVMFVDHANYPFKVKLIDFGLARNTYKLCKLSEIQNVGYRAPEVVFGLPKNESVDMWSLGCNLAFMYLFRDLFMVTCDSLELQDEKEIEFDTDTKDDKTVQWETRSEISTFPAKTKELAINFGRLVHTQLYITAVEIVPHTNFLDVHIPDNHTWKQHTSSAVKARSHWLSLPYHCWSTEEISSSGY